MINPTTDVLFTVEKIQYRARFIGGKVKYINRMALCGYHGSKRGIYNQWQNIKDPGIFKFLKQELIAQGIEK